MTDRGAHIIDIAQLALGMDNSGPVKFQASGKQIKNSPYDAFWDYEFTNTYENGVRMIGTTEGPRGLKGRGCPLLVLGSGCLLGRGAYIIYKPQQLSRSACHELRPRRIAALCGRLCSWWASS